MEEKHIEATELVPQDVPAQDEPAAAVAAEQTPMPQAPGGADVPPQGATAEPPRAAAEQTPTPQALGGADIPPQEVSTEPPQAAATDADAMPEKPPTLYRLPRICIVLFAIAGVSAIVYFIAMRSTAVADFISRYPGSVIRAVLAHLTNWLPCSLAEALVLFLPVILFFLIRTAIKKYSDCWHNTLVYLGTLLSVASLLFTLMVWGFGTGYYGRTLDVKLGLDRRDVSAEELKYTAEQLVEQVNLAAEEVTFRYQNFSVMPYSLDEMNDKLLEAYDKVSDEYSFVQRLHSRVKPVVNSELWSYTHITGVYSYFTGEANINVNFPDYSIVYTAAHELAHQRGIAREDEANFMAFLVCTASDDPYIRYCGYLNMYEYVRNSLYSASLDMYSEVNGSLCLEVRYELYSYSQFFDKYRHNVVADVSETVNDTYLKLQGTPGTRSYGMVTDLAVAYYKSK